MNINNLIEEIKEDINNRKGLNDNIHIIMEIWKRDLNVTVLGEDKKLNNQNIDEIMEKIISRIIELKNQSLGISLNVSLYGVEYNFRNRIFRMENGNLIDHAEIKSSAI